MEAVDIPMMDLGLNASAVPLLPVEELEHPRRQSSTPSLANRVAPPQSEEEWVEFIDNYIRYGFVTQSDLFLPADEKSQLPPRAELSSGESTETASAGELTPIQESVELPASLSEQKFQMEDLTTPRPHDMDISPSSSDTGPFFSTPRRPSSSKGDSDEYSRKCRTMSTCSTGSMSGSGALGESRRLEAHRVKQFYEQNGFLCAPAQLPKDVKKRLRAIRRLGFDGHDTYSIRRETLDRYTRLLTSILKAKMSTVTILGADTQLFPSEVGLGIQKLDTDLGICTHTALSTERPLVVEDADKDWRFSNHPMVQSGAIKSYCGAPLRQGKTAAIIGTLCVIDDKPRPDFNTEAQKIVKELAACVSNELELLAQADEQKLAQKMHDRALKFSRHWLQSTSSSTRTISKHKPNGRTRKRKKQVNIVTTENGSEQDEQISVYDEACQYVADTIGASCTIIDTSSFHIAYPVSPVPPSLEHSQSIVSGGESWQPDTAEGEGVSEMVLSPVDEAPEGGSFQNNVALEPLQPQVYHLPKRSTSLVEDNSKDASLRSAGILGCSDKSPSLPNNMSDILMAAIVHNLQTRKIWYETADGDAEGDKLDDPEEADIKLLMGEHSAALVLPVFDYKGQVPFLFVARSSEDIFAFDAAALGFVESICSTVLASAMRTELITTDESQRSFASMANHELKTPLHQILMCAHDLRETLEIGLDESRSPTVDEKTEMFKLCDIILGGAEKTQGILNAVLEYHSNVNRTPERPSFAQIRNSEDTEEMEDVIAEALHDAVEQEKLKKAALGQDLSLVETVVEIVPRKTGWKIARDGGAIKKILEYLLVNAFHATTEGYVLITCEDISQHSRMVNGYDDATITARIRVKDVGCGMQKEFYESGQIFEPFVKVDKFSSGAGLGVPLAKRKIESMGGSIDYESQPGKGTLVTIEVPLQIQPGQQDTDNSPSKVKLSKDRCVLLGFEDSSQFGIRVVGDFLKRKLERRNVVICKAEDANSIIIEERALNEASVQKIQQMVQLRQIDTIVLGSATSKRRWRSNPPFLDQECTIRVRWLFRPLNPSLIRQIMQGGRGSSVTSEYDRRRPTTWPSHSSQPSLTGSYLQMNAAPSYASGDSLPGTENQPTHPHPPEVEMPIGVVGAESPSPLEEVMANTLESDLQALKQCLPASELKVLIVEDNAINRQVLARMIKKLGHPYEEAEDGVVGVEMYKTFRPSLVLMDIDMPKKCGLEASADIRAYEAKYKIPKAPIVVVTAITDDAAIARGKKECQVDHWLVKPLGFKLLKEKIKEIYDIQT